MRYLLVIIFFSLTACATTQNVVVPQPNMPPLATAITSASAGAVTVDITPPPGMPMGGYSVMANRGQGFRTRIKARVIYLNDGQGEALAMVQTDLTAASLLLHHQVAALVAKETGLAPGNIAITASHSHSAPANFFDNDFYNKHMSSGKWLEADFLAFAAERISAGIKQAHQERRPAKIATGKQDLYGYQRNRSLTAYLANEGVAVTATTPDAHFKAVDPALHMVRIDVQDDDGAFKPLAALSSFSIHATALTPKVEVYNADLFAYVQKDLEWHFQQASPWPVVHAFSTANQGDMAPALPDNGNNKIGQHPVDWPAAKALGQRLGAEAIALFTRLEASLDDDITLASAARELNIRHANEAKGIAICTAAAVGNPVAGGAYERRTPWLTLVPLLHGGNIFARRWLFTNGCQGNKRQLGSAWLQPLLEPKDSFPNTVMFQLLRINDMAILPLPFEVTIEAGRRMRSAVKEVFDEHGTPLAYTWIASAANGYFGYTTTPEEYATQHYEGGHTLYGKNSSPYLGAQLSKLAHDFLQHGSVQELAEEWIYPLKTNHFLPQSQPSTGKRQWLAAPNKATPKRTTDEPYVAVRWLDVAPSNIGWHQRLVEVEHKVAGEWQPLVINGEPIHDDGYDIEVRYLHDHKDGMAAYETRWYNPQNTGTYRFVIAPRKGQPTLRSPAFR